MKQTFVLSDPPPPPLPFQEITVVHHGILGVVPVHALPLEEASGREPGRLGTAGQALRPHSTSGGGMGSTGTMGAGSGAPLVVLDRWVLVLNI